MSRPHLPAGFLLMVICLSGASFVWCYADPSYVTPPNPLDALFRAHPSRTQKHSGSVSAIHNSNGSDAVGSSTPRNTKPAEHKPQHQSSESLQQLPPFVSAVVQAKHLGVIRRRAVEQERRVDKRHRWLAEHRFDTFPAYRALPVVDYGGPSENEDLPNLGEPRPVDTFDLRALQPTKNELIDGSLSLPTFRVMGQPRIVSMMEPAVQNYPVSGGHSAQSIDLIREQLERIKQEEDIEIKSNLLLKLLAELPTGPLPIVYVEDVAGLAGMTNSVGDDDDDGDDGDEDEDEDVFGVVDEDEGRLVTGQFTPNGDKRAGRYYRPYPWKRQNARSRTNDLLQPRNLCVPSREDVFKLLVSLHENRNDRQTVNFCNRKRPARAIFTNIRFLG